MKKFWNLMLAALVIIGAAACTENNESVDVVESLSFYAEIGNDDTRAYIADEDGDKKWTTVFEGEETLYVNDEYAFKNTIEEPGKFTCTAVGVSKLAGQKVTIKTDGTHHSLQGKAAFNATATVENFGAEKVKLQALTSFFRLTFNGAGNVKLALSENKFRNDDKSETNEITLKGASGDIFLAFWPGEELKSSLTLTINGKVIKNAENLTFKQGKVYNLGTFDFSYEVSNYSVPGTHNNWTAGATPMYVVGNYCVAYGVEAKEFKILGNDKWYGVSETLNLNTWTPVVDGDAKNIIVTEGRYDIYFSETRTMLCVVEAGAEVPELAEIEWALAGNFNEWGNTVMSKTETANLFVAKGVELSTGTAIKVKDAASWDTSYGGGINNLEPNKWMTVYSNGADIVIAKSGMYDVYFQYATSPKLYLVEAEGDYTAAVEQTANGTPVPDEVETPDVITPDQPSDWAFYYDPDADNKNWQEAQMLTTDVANVFALKNVKMTADYGGVLIKKWGDTAWTIKYGGGITYFNPGNYMVLSANGSDIFITKAGTYDFYFDYTNTRFYVVAAGADYNNVSEQTTDGEAPVVLKKLYLKPNSNWTKDGARFAAYFFGNGEKWVSMTAVNGKSGYYEVTVPDGYPNVIFCRMNPSASANNWGNKWNQTSDLVVPTNDNNLYTVKEGTWDKGGGSWSVMKL